jgi:hypothetical protein
VLPSVPGKQRYAFTSKLVGAAVFLFRYQAFNFDLLRRPRSWICTSANFRVAVRYILFYFCRLSEDVWQANFELGTTAAKGKRRSLASA